MATVRPKDLSKTSTAMASDDYLVTGGSTNGTRKLGRNDFRSDLATALKGDPTTYKLAPLNASNKIDASYLPTNGDTPKGGWNANTNSPSLADGTGTAGDYYDVTTAGSSDLGSGAITFTVGDVVKYNGTVWYKIDSVANVLDGTSTAAGARTILEVDSTDESAEATGPKLIRPEVRFDGVNDYAEISNSTKFDFTSGDDDTPFTIEGWVRVASNTQNFTLYSAWDSTREVTAYIDTSGKVTLGLSDGTNDTYAVGSTVIPVDTWTHVAICYPGAGPNSSDGFTSNQTNTQIYVNKDADTVTPTNNASYTGLTAVSQAHRFGFQSGAYASGAMGHVRVINRQLSADEVGQAADGNLPYADSLGESYGSNGTIDETTGVSSWTGSGSITLGNITETANTTVGGRPNVLKLEATATSGGETRFFFTSGTTLGKRIRVDFDYYIDSGNTTIDTITGLHTGGSTVISANTSGAWTRASIEMTVGEGGSSSTLQIKLTDNGANNATAGDFIGIDNFAITQIGTVADMRSENYDPDTQTWIDSSDNNFTASGSGISLVGRPLPYYYTSTFTPSLEFGGGSTGLTVSAAQGLVTRVGRTAHVEGRILLSAKGSSTGTAKITGLPFNGEDVTVSTCGFHVNYIAGMASLNSMPTILVDDAGTEATLYHINDASGSGASSTALTHSNLTNTTDIRFSGTYTL